MRSEVCAESAIQSGVEGEKEREGAHTVKELGGYIYIHSRTIGLGRSEARKIYAEREKETRRLQIYNWLHNNT